MNLPGQSLLVIYVIIMRFFVLAALGFLTGVRSTEDICRYYAHDKCKVYSIVPRPFPSNEEELQNACSNLATIKECIAEYMKTCLGTGREKESPNQEYQLYMTEGELEREKNRILCNLKDDQRLIDVATEICEENSKLRNSFVPDMNCFKEIFDKNDKDHICMNYTTNGLNYLRSRINRLRLERSEEYNNVCLCLRVLLDMNCFVEQFDKECSSLAKDTVLEIIEKAGSLYYQCPVSSRLDILELLDDLKLVTKKDIYVRQLLETDSFF